MNEGELLQTSRPHDTDDLVDRLFSDREALVAAVRRLMLERKSVRRYSAQPVTDEEVRLILEAAGRAPTGENLQPWRFIVVRDQAKKDALGAIGQAGSGRRFTAEFVTHKMQERFAHITDPEKKSHVFKTLVTGNVSRFIADAPVAIMICSQRRSWDTWPDASACIENMLLMATALGLGACWVGAMIQDVRDERKLDRMFSIPPQFKIIATVAVGHPERIPNLRPRRKLEEHTYSEMFGVPFVPGAVVKDSAASRDATSDEVVVDASSSVTSYLNSVVYALERLFFEQCGESAQFRTCAVGWDFLLSNPDIASKLGSYDQTGAAIVTALKETGVVQSVEAKIIEQAMMPDAPYYSRVRILEVDTAGCLHLPVEKALQSAHTEPYVCPIANLFAYAAERAEDIITEIASIEVDHSSGRCRTRIVLFDPRVGDEGERVY